MAKVLSVNISEKKGERKHPVPEIRLKLRHGIAGDAHAGDWHRRDGGGGHPDRQGVSQ